MQNAKYPAVEIHAAVQKVVDDNRDFVGDSLSAEGVDDLLGKVALRIARGLAEEVVRSVERGMDEAGEMDDPLLARRVISETLADATESALLTTFLRGVLVGMHLERVHRERQVLA